MSVPIIWMPLTGDLRNIGVSNVTVTNSGATVNASGKIGSCYSFDGNDCIQTDYVPNVGTGDFTLSAWIYLTQTSGKTYQPVISSKSTAAASAGISIYWNQNQKKFLWSTADGSSATEIWTIEQFDSVVYDSWHHIVMVRNSSDPKKGYFYFDGVRKELTSVPVIRNIASSQAFRIGAVNPASSAYYWTGKINDIRFYDAALSEQEIKKISQALVIHYPLDGNGLGGLNEMPNAIEMPYGTANAALGRWRNAGSSSMTKKRVHLDSSPVGPCYAFQNSGVQTPNDGSCWGIDSFPREPNTDYCISAWARITEGTEGYVGFNVYNTTYVDGFDLVDKNYRVTQLPADGSWKRVYCHVKTNSSTTGNIYIGTTTGDTSVTTQMCAIKLEKGSVPTDWSPAAADMPGYDETKVYDISGFRNDGTVVDATALSTSIDAIRYRTSTEFDGVTGCVLIPFDANLWQTNFSMSIWFKKFDIGSKNYETLIGGKSGFEMDTRAGASTTLALYMASTRGGTLWSPFEMNKWYMVALVNDGTNEFYYINGSLVKTIDKKAMPIGQYYLGSWNGVAGQNFKGYMSDFRVYATALSSSDVKDLYQAGRTVRT